MQRLVDMLMYVAKKKSQAAPKKRPLTPEEKEEADRLREVWERKKREAGGRAYSQPAIALQWAPEPINQSAVSQPRKITIKYTIQPW